MVSQRLDRAHAEVMMFYAPTVNSYKRFVDASWAPTRLAWSYDNRTAGFRVVGHDPSLRIECRIPGPDCNPYLAFAASLARGLDVIEHRMEPPDCFTGTFMPRRICRAWRARSARRPTPSHPARSPGVCTAPMLSSACRL
jgi:glutamine synthetase